MRSASFVDNNLSEVIPPLMDVTELDADELKSRVAYVYGAKIETIGGRSTASMTFTDGIPDTPSDIMGDFQQLGELEDFSRAIVVGGGYTGRKRSALEVSLAAMVRIADRDLTDMPRHTKRLIGEKGLWLTRQAIGLSLTTGPVRYSHGYSLTEKRDPDLKIQSHAEAYSELLPYMTRNQRKLIKPKLYQISEAIQQI